MKIQKLIDLNSSENWEDATKTIFNDTMNSLQINTICFRGTQVLVEAEPALTFPSTEIL